MKKEVLVMLLSVIFIQCFSNIKQKDSCNEATGSDIFGSMSISNLEGFKLKADSFLVKTDALGYYVEKDTLGYYGIPDLSANDIKHVRRTAEIYECKYNNGQLLLSLNFCKAVVVEGGKLQVIIHGSANPRFNDVLTLDFIEHSVIATYIIPFYRNGMILHECDIKTGLLHVSLNKYPLKKGDLLRGSLSYKACKSCVSGDKGQIVSEPLFYQGYFEAIIE